MHHGFILLNVLDIPSFIKIWFETLKLDNAKKHRLQKPKYLKRLILPTQKRQRKMWRKSIYFSVAFTAGRIPSMKSNALQRCLS